MSLLRDFIKPRLARLGKIRLGTKALSGKGNEYPKDLPSFRVPEEVAVVYGDEPTSLDVMVPCAEFAEFCPIELQLWGADERKICHSKDGQTAMRWSDEKSAWEEVPCAYKDCPKYGKKRGQGCDERGSLMVILPQVSLAGVYQVDTGSRTGLGNLYNEYETFRQVLHNLTGNGDAVRAVVFRLTRELDALHYVDESGARQKVDKYILHLRAPNLGLPQAQQLAARFGRGGAPMLSTGESLQLPDPDGDDLCARVLPGIPPAADLPEDALEECPCDLVPNASPVGADIGQKAAWAALMAQAKSLGLDTNKGEVALCRQISRDAVRFDDLTSEEATVALERMGAAVCKRQAEQAAEPKQEPAPEPASATPLTNSQMATAVTRRQRQAKPQQFPPTSVPNADGELVPASPDGGPGVATRTTGTRKPAGAVGAMKF